MQGPPVEEFAWRRKAKGQRDSYCRPCRSDYKQEHYAANRQRYIDAADRRRKEVIAKRVAFLVAYLRDHPCVDCGETDPIVLEFDHLRDKEFSVGKGIRDRAWRSVPRGDGEVRGGLRELPSTPNCEAGRIPPSRYRNG